MRVTRIILLALFLTGALAGAASAATSVAVGVRGGPAGHATVDLGFFYDDLAPYGNWVERPHYGWVWRPHAVASQWRPYENGHWAWTDEGWTWITNEPYGWATYHYGRWYNDAGQGWEWVPGNEWAPAWVSWQGGGNYIGWAPLPPSVEFRAGRLAVSLAADAYLFVPERRFLDPSVGRYAVPLGDRERIFRQTSNYTDYQVVNRRVINQGVPVDRIQRVVGRRVPRYQIAETDGNQRHQGSRIAQNRVSVYRPQVTNGRVAPPPERLAAKHAAIAAPVAGRVAPPQKHQMDRAEHGKMARQAPPAAHVHPQAKPAHETHQARVQTTEVRKHGNAHPQHAVPVPHRTHVVAVQHPHPQHAVPAREQRAAVERPKKGRPPHSPVAAAQQQPRQHGGQNKAHGQGQPQGKPHGKAPDKQHDQKPPQP